MPYWGPVGGIYGPLCLTWGLLLRTKEVVQLRLLTDSALEFLGPQEAEWWVARERGFKEGNVRWLRFILLGQIRQD